MKQSSDERPLRQHVIPDLDGDLFRACLRARGFRLNGTALYERAELLGVHRFARVVAELAPKVLLLRVASKATVGATENRWSTRQRTRLSVAL